MATFRKRNGRWQVQVRILGAKPHSRTFIRKEDAKRWSVETEAEIQRAGLARGVEALRRSTVRDVVVRYRDTVTVGKRTRKNETITLNAFLRHPLARRGLVEVTSKHFADYRDERLALVKPATVNRELTTLRHVFRTAATWGLPLQNPLAGVSRASGEQPRDRRLAKGEWKALIAASNACLNPHVRPVIEFAIETGMRRAEILNARWGDIDTRSRLLHIPRSKTGQPRTIPLGPRALAILRRQAAGNVTQPFPVTSVAFTMAWKRLLLRGGLRDLHFHDLRHEAVSRFFEMGLTVPEVALISGHKDPRMLFRYTHLRAEDVAAKLK